MLYFLEGMVIFDTTQNRLYLIFLLHKHQATFNFLCKCSILQYDQNTLINICQKCKIWPKKSLWWLWPWLSIPRALAYNLCANLLGSGAEGPYHSPPGSEPLRVLGGSLSLVPSGPDDLSLSLSGLSCLLDGQRILHLWLTWPGFNLSGAIV